jgi:hypothetical protein
MTTTAYTINASSIGTTIGPPDGAIVWLSMSIAPAYQTPCWDAGGQQWVAGCLTLRGTGDCHDAVCVSPQTNGGAFSGGVMISSSNGSVGYTGDLTVVAAPNGSVWSLTLTDSLGRSQARAEAEA